MANKFTGMHSIRINSKNKKIKHQTSNIKKRENNKIEIINVLMVVPNPRNKETTQSQKFENLTSGLAGSI